MPFKARKRSQYLAGVRSIVSTISESINDVGRIALLVIGLSFFWASIGMITFGSSVPLDFNTLLDGNLTVIQENSKVSLIIIFLAYFTLFVSLTQIGWIDNFDQLTAKNYFSEAFLFYITYMFLISYVLFKTIVAVLVSNLVSASLSNSTLIIHHAVCCRRNTTENLV